MMTREGLHSQQAEILTAGPVIEVPFAQIFEEVASL